MRRRQHQADLAVNKELAAAGRSKARDIADLVAIGGNFCPLDPLVLVAAGKPPNFSPRRTIDEIRRHTLSIPAEDYAVVKGLAADWSAEFIREESLRLLDAADAYVMGARAVLVGMRHCATNSSPAFASTNQIPAFSAWCRHPVRRNGDTPGAPVDVRVA